jgi:hypothetical protein
MNTPHKTINATLRMTQSDWDALQVKAQEMGMTRTQFLIQIARGEIPVEKKALQVQEQQLLGKY